jgi:aspartate carbamoyltransferase catalytic subunit
MLKDLVSINDLSAQEILEILGRAREIELTDPKEKLKLLAGKTVATLFFEPSTRTKLSFETAIQNLGGRVIGFAESESSSISKGESLIDTIKTVERYADLIVIRHPLMGSARLAADISKRPVINAGDGANQHPTQTLLDLYTIKKSFGKIEQLKIGFLGDLKYSRAVHSLAIALSNFDCEKIFISPQGLRLPKYIIQSMRKEKIYESEDLSSWIGKLDVLYVVRIQKERFLDPLEYEKVKNTYRVRKEDLRDVKPTFKLMHPLPRLEELDRAIDLTGYALYFEQLSNGIPVREAILHILSKARK